MEYEVTIGIPVYQAAGYIEKTMESALNQTFESIEYLVIDDGGGDGSIEVVERLKSVHPRGGDIHIFYHDGNCGVGVARNHILDEAKGRYLFFLDSDDLIEPDTINMLVGKMNDFQADVAYGSLDRIDMMKHSPIRSSVLPDATFLSANEMAMYAFANYSTFPISVCNCLMRIDFLRGHQLRFLDTVFWEDLAFTYEMVTKVERAVLSSTVTYHYLCRPGSLSHYQDREQLDKVEIMNNVSTIDYLKRKCPSMKDKAYLPYLTYNLEMNSFYIVCHILKHYRRIVPEITNGEIHQALCHPVRLCDILHFPHKQFANLMLWLLGTLPAPLSVPAVWLLGKTKRAL